MNLGIEHFFERMEVNYLNKLEIKDFVYVLLVFFAINLMTMIFRKSRMRSKK